MDNTLNILYTPLTFILSHTNPIASIMRRENYRIHELVQFNERYSEPLGSLAHHAVARSESGLKHEIQLSTSPQAFQRTIKIPGRLTLEVWQSHCDDFWNIVISLNFSTSWQQKLSIYCWNWPSDYSSQVGTRPDRSQLLISCAIVRGPTCFPTVCLPLLSHVPQRFSIFWPRVAGLWKT